MGCAEGRSPFLTMTGIGGWSSGFFGPARHEGETACTRRPRRPAAPRRPARSSRGGNVSRSGRGLDGMHDEWAAGSAAGPGHDADGGQHGDGRGRGNESHLHTSLVGGGRRKEVRTIKTISPALRGGRPWPPGRACSMTAAVEGECGRSRRSAAPRALLLDGRAHDAPVLGPGPVVVAHLVDSEDLREDEPGVGRALADTAIGDGFAVGLDALPYVHVP